MDDNNRMNHKDLQQNNPNDENIDMSKTKEINYAGFFLTIGIGLGVSFGIVFDNLAIGISIGVVLGLGVGAVVGSIKKKNKE